MVNQFLKACLAVIFLVLILSLSFDVTSTRSLSRQKATSTLTVQFFDDGGDDDDDDVWKRLSVPRGPSTEIYHHQRDAENSMATKDSALSLSPQRLPTTTKQVPSPPIAMPMYYVELSAQTSSSPSAAPSIRPKAKVVTVVTPKPQKRPQKLPSSKVLCIQGPFWGQTFNRIIQMANALTLAHERGGVAVGLDEKWTAWYQGFLDPRPDILFNYTTSSFNRSCAWSLTPKEAFRYYHFDMQRCMKYLQALIPKVAYREQAEAALAVYQRPITTVHRRNLEGKCVEYAPSYQYIVCPSGPGIRKKLSVQNLLDICNLEYKMIANETQGTSVVLLTDSQVPELDQTFARISNHSFPVQTWMMVLSDIHYGNPFSTVDLIVYYWRVGLGKTDSTRPNSCYRPRT